MPTALNSLATAHQGRMQTCDGAIANAIHTVCCEAGYHSAYLLTKPDMHCTLLLGLPWHVPLVLHRLSARCLQYTGYHATSPHLHSKAGRYDPQRQSSLGDWQQDGEQAADCLCPHQQHQLPNCLQLLVAEDSHKSMQVAAFDLARAGRVGLTAVTSNRLASSWQALLNFANADS